MPEETQEALVAAWNARSQGSFPGALGLEITSIAAGTAEGRLPLRPEHLAPNGYLHAAVVIGLADTLAGYGCGASLPPGATGFTTIELKSNFLGTAREGAIEGVARLQHGGRSTQVWDAEVRASATGATIALFRCTQIILYPR